MRDSLDELFAGVDAGRLPSLPHVLVKLLDISFTEGVSFDELSDLIKQDAGLTMRVTNAANTAYYAGQGKDLEFDRTLVLLGLDTIKTIAITACVQQFFSRFETASSRRLKGFWRNSLTCALIAKRLAKLLGYPYQEEAYLAGLIHNVGELVFEANYAHEHDSICSVAENQAEKLKLEEQQIGANHFQAGAWLVSGWDIDSFMEDAILFQGETAGEIREAHSLVKIIYLANQMSQDYDALSDEAFLSAKALFDLDHGLLEEVVSKTRDDVIAAATSLDIDIGQHGDAMGDQDSSDKQLALADRVRNIATLNSMIGAKPCTSETELLRLLQKSLHLLFGIRDCLYLKVAADGEKQESVLQGEPLSGQPESIAELTITLDGHSLAAQSLRDSALLGSHGTDITPAVVDKQLARLLDAAGVLCLPLIQNNKPLGVWVFKADAAAQARYQKQARLLHMWAHEAGTAIDQQRATAQKLSEQQQDEQNYYHGRAREIVHEVNNPLSIVKNYVHLLGQKLTDNEEVGADLEVIREELERAGSILLRLPGIVGQQLTAGGNERVNLNQLVNDLLRLFRGSLFATGQVEAFADLDPDMEPVIVDRHGVRQVLTNLIKNAAEALPEGGRITLSTRGLVNQNGENYVAIIVADNGPGIPAPVQEKLFSPVETTKGEAHAGLGLSIVKNLLTEMGGTISCQSSAKEGTRFELLIPRVLDD